MRMPSARHLYDVISLTHSLPYIMADLWPPLPYYFAENHSNWLIYTLAMVQTPENSSERAMVQRYRKYSVVHGTAAVDDMAATDYIDTETFDSPNY